MAAGGTGGKGGTPPKTKSLVDRCQEIAAAVTGADAIRRLDEVVGDIEKAGNAKPLLDILTSERNVTILTGAMAAVYTKTVYGIYSQDYDQSDAILLAVANLTDHGDAKLKNMAIVILAFLLRDLDWSRIQPDIRRIDPSVENLPAYFDIKGSVA